MNRRVSLLVAFVGVNLMACCCGGVGNSTPKTAMERVQIPFPTGDETELRQRFGEPDNVAQGINTRVVSYWRHRVEAVYKRSGNMMLFSRFQDSETKEEIDGREVLIRMGRDTLAEKLIADAKAEDEKADKKSADEKSMPKKVAGPK